MSIPKPPAGFKLDDDDDDLPPPPPGFAVDAAPVQPAPVISAPPKSAPRLPAATPVSKALAALPSLGNDSIVGPVDGDTAHLKSGRSLRLYGVDAPELKQQGWNRQGQAVPIGQQSRDDLGDALARARAAIGMPVGNSFGRPVAPVDMDGQDLGQSLARNGSVMTAPDFMRDDPDRRFQYLQAERLARQNGLGIHDTMFQNPADFRKNPLPTPGREQVAQFWDTPTPFAGMRPELEQQFTQMVNDMNVPVADVVAFARDNGGFIVDPANVASSRAQVRKSGIAAGMAYQEPVKPLTDLDDGTTGAMIRGFGNGVLPNFLEETGAIPDTLGLTDGRENIWNSDRRFADIYSNNLGQNESIIGYDRFAHPYATMGAEVAGGLVAPMGKINSAADMAKFGALYGGAAGLGQDGSIPERLTSGVIGAGTGLGITVGAGKALEKLAPHVFDMLPRRGRVDGPPASAPRLPDYLDMSAPPPPAGYALDDVTDGFIVRQPDRIDRDGPDIRPVEQAPLPVAPDYLTNNATPGGVKDVLANPDPSDMRALVIGPDGRVHVLNDPAGHQAFREAAGSEANGFAEISNYRDEYALRRPENPTAAQLRTINEFGARARRDGLYLTEGGIDGGNSPAMSRQRDIIDIGDVPPPPKGFTMDRPGSMAMAGDAGASLSAAPRRADYLDMADVPPPPRGFTMDQPQRMGDPLSDATRRAIAADIMPRDLLPIPSNMVDGVEEAAHIESGRFAEARVPHERTELGKRTVRGWNGAEVPKVGPVDMVGWLRTHGGLMDQGGELSHMGLTNAGRKMDFAGTENRFGPLVNPEGMNLDDAAMRAWEAGYFPDHANRPSVNEFLDALRDTHEGRNRRFLPEDFAEIDRFYGTQGERYALEQQRFEEGGPIWQDKSVPAGEDTPFPPVSAYEEWPAGGPDFAGNINLTKLESPQDISRALSQVGRRFSFDAATRGRITHAETERLASELNMTPQQLLARRQGQPLNAEEALAARQIMVKSGNEILNFAKRVQALDNPGDEMMAEFQRKLVMHAAIQEQVSGMTAEAGRALQSFRITANSNAVRGDILAALVNSGGGKRGLKNAADVILEAAELSPGKFNAVLDKLAKPTWRDKAIELLYISKLSNPATHVVNAVSNALTAVSQPIEFAAGAAIGKARSVFNPDTDRVLASEVGARAYGLLKGAREGIPAMVRAWRTGEASDFVQRIEMRHENALPGKFGHHARTPLRALTAADEFFKAIASRMHIDGMAVRMAHKEGLRGDAATARIAELTVNPTDEMLRDSMEYARYVTFQTPLGDFGRGIQQAKQGNIPATMVVPFIRTPTNLFKFAAERSILAPFLEGWRKDIAAGGARRDVAIAKATVASGVAAAVYFAAAEGVFTGSRPMDPKKTQFMQADGWQPYSLKVGDKYYSYSRMDPFSTTFGVAADMATQRDGMTERQAEDYAALLTASVIKNMTDKVYLSGVSDLLEAVNDWQRFGPGYLRNFVAGNTIPAVSGGIERSVDPEARDAQSVGEAMRARIPGLSSSLPQKRDIWGEPIVSEGGVGPDIMSPSWTSTAKNDPVNREMLEIGARFDDPKRWIKKDGQRIDLNPQQYERYSEVAGRGTRKAIEALMADPAWSGLPVEQRAKNASDAAEAAKKAARAELFNAVPRKSGLLGSSTRSLPRDVPRKAPPPPKGFTEDGAAGGVNVYADLQSLIPGVQFTSGFRTPEYQADMRRRGYKPASNSGHLDGTALDMLPPPGKSMSWLRDQVGRYDPNAKLLIHDGHLHATFPGYYGAPVLGGAKGAGIRNPNAGMPPPPPGFKLD